MTNIIPETCGLTKLYGGVHALSDANFVMHKCKHVANMGYNEAGKSIFVRQLTGVEQPTRGQIIFDGVEHTFANPIEAREAGIETVFQNLALADDLDVPSNLFLGRGKFLFKLGRFSIMDKKAMRDATIAAPEKTAVKIAKLMNTIRKMSGGQRQSVAIARTAAFKLKLVIMDEPTAAGEPLILISHNMRQVFDLVDRIVVFRRGRIVANLRKAETNGQDVVAYFTGAKTGARSKIRHKSQLLSCTLPLRSKGWGAGKFSLSNPTAPV